MAGAVLTDGWLVGCGGTAPSTNGDAVVDRLWSDVTNAYTPLLADVPDASGVRIIRTIVPYNQRLGKINTAVRGGGDAAVVQMDTV